MSARRPRSRARSRTRIVSALPVLTAADRRLATGLAAAIEGLQVMARGLLDGEPEQAETRFAVFSAACVEAADSFSGANLLPLLAGPERAVAAAVLAALAERTALGHPPQADPADSPGPTSEADFEEVDAEINRLEETDLLYRLEEVVGDPEVAGLLVGVHLAREGDNNPFAAPTWSDQARVESLLAAAIATAALAMIAQDQGAPPTGPAIGDLLHVVQATYATLSPLDQAELPGGFGTMSRVIEPCLWSTDLLDDLELTDDHRLSAGMVNAFLAGRLDEPADLSEETGEQAQALLRAAAAVGQALVHGASDEERASDPFALPASPTARHLLN